MLARLARQTITAAAAAAASSAPSTSGRCALPCRPLAAHLPLPLPRLRTLAAASQGSGIEPPDVRKLAQMATIDVTDEEVRKRGTGEVVGRGASRADKKERRGG
jgi:pyruvate/2-oxoglutarate dehydrogenase complex dihydrolipoamide acyltransferase (E2) component